MKYLITGNTGSGKTSVAESLRNKGFYAIDADSLSHWLEHSTGKTYSSRPRKTPDWQKHYEWLWNETKIQKILDESIGRIFLCGVASNQVKFYPSFDKIFLLDIDVSLLSERLSTRATSPFGQRPGDINATLERHKNLNNKILEAGAVRIDASRPLHEVVEEILRNTDED